MTAPSTRNRLDTATNTLAGIAPVTALIYMVGYSLDRAKAAARDERGFSVTVQELFWAVIAVSIVAVVSVVIYNAVVNRGSDVGDQIENRSLP